MLRLKPLKKGETYDLAVCAASRCTEQSAVIDGTGKLDDRKLPFCDHHAKVRWPEDEPLLPPEPTPVVRLRGLSRAELRAQAKKAGVGWEKSWSKKQARIAIRKAMKEATA